MEFTGERLVLGQTDKELEIEHINRYKFAQQFVTKKRVLDAACGTGYGTQLLAQYAVSAVGVDISEEAIEYACEQYQSDKINFCVASVEKLPFPDASFDVVVSFETLEHIDEKMQTRFLGEIKRVLSPQGILVMSTPNHSIYCKRGVNSFHVKELEFDEFEELLRTRFDAVKFYSQKDEISNAVVSESNEEASVRYTGSCRTAEYLIAVCSDSEIPSIKNQIYIRDDNKLEQLMAWAVDNHYRNEKNNKHIALLDDEINDLREKNEAHISRLNSEINILKGKNEAHISRLNSEINILKGKNEALLHQIQKQKDETRLIVQQLNNKQGHIELLLESDRELERIKNSRSWRYMGYVWKIRDVLIPCGSKRRMLGKIIVKFVKHPIRFIGKCSPERIHKFFITLRREGTEGVSRRLDDCLIGNNIQTTQLVLNEVNLAAQKTAADYEVLYVPTQDKPVISIVIPVYNQFEYTYFCIKSILENSGDVAYEIIIADDCSTDLTTEIDEIIHGVHTIHNESNLRFLRNCNNAAKQARGQYILFLNNDTQVQADWLAPLIELIERDDSIGMVGSKLVYPDGRLQEAGGILWQDGSAWNYGNRANPDEPEFNYVKEADYISGAAIMIRKSLWEEIGGFDERFVPAYCEDSDLAFEVRKHGCKVMYQPKSVVVHFEGVSNGTDTTSGQKAYQVTNQKKFLEKWQRELQENHLPNAVDPFRARERSVHKKILLMVDHYVPHYDKDAGSRTVYQYLQLFVNQGFSVKFIGDNFFAHQPYTDTLQQMGVEVLYGPYYAKHWKDWLKENGKDIGYVFLNRPHISVKYIDAVREFTNARVIYYGHDLHFLREKREYELTGDAALLQSSADWEKKELELILAADMAYYPSYVEEQAIHEIAPQAKVKAIPAYLFSDVEECEYHFDKRKDLMFIGGFGHRPNVDAVKWLANEIMPALVKKLPDIRVYILGSNPPEEVKQLANENLLIKGFVTDEELQEYYQNCRISIVPLRYGAGIKGKVIEAMRFGTPVMTTSVGAEGIKGAESILDIADEAADFVEQLAALYQNEAELVRRSKASYQYIRDNFSFENAKKVIGPEFDLE